MTSYLYGQAVLLLYWFMVADARRVGKGVPRKQIATAVEFE